MGMCVDPGVFRWCQALSRSRSCTTVSDHQSASRLALPPYQPGHHHPSTNTTTALRRCSSGDSQQQRQRRTPTISTTNSKIQPVSNYNISHNASDDNAVCGRNSSLSESPTTVRVKRSTVFDQYRKLSRAELATVCRGILRLLLLLQWFAFGCCTINPPQDAVHITAILGESVVFNCHVDFPGDHPVPYVLQWEKKVSEKGQEIPIFIWYESYPTHSGEGYEGRVSRVPPNSTFGAASLNLTDIRESDQGWYECKVVFLNRPPKQHKNGTWFHLDVHAPPRFSVTPEDIIYVNLGDSIILNCQADGTPTPEILWYKDANPVDPSSTVGIFNDGTELRISTIRHEDIGDYTCIARNGEGQVSHTARVIIAGGAVIMVPPTNQTKLEGEKVQFTCEAKAMPGNVTVRWFREGSPVREVAALETRVTIRKDGSLIINPVSADDSGQYTCEVSNGIGEPQSASAYLNIEYPAKVTFTPTIQYLPFRLAGVVQCYIKANPPLQYVTWTKDKRLLEPYQTKDIVIMNNGSLLFTRVNQNHQGRYTCTPYNAQGTQGSSGHMEVLVRKPPAFTVEPDPLYQRKVGESVEMHCDAQEAEGTSKPTIQWQRRDGQPLQKNRVRISNGNITIENLRRSDFGYYQCVASNEVATIVSATQLVIEGTQPHAPYNLSGSATEFSVTLSWMPGYSGGPDYKQDYTIWYREAGVSEWSTIPVTPSGSTQVTINRLSPGTTYEFQVIGKNALGDGMMSKVITIRTLDAQKAKKPSTTTAAPNDKEFKHAPEDLGPKPGQPRNVSVLEIPNGFLISWQVPLERAHLVQFYTIKYRTDAQWKTLNRGQIRPEETSYLVKNLVGGRTYYFRVLANSLKSYETSDEIKFPVPARVKHKAITAGVVGGILFFIVAIILSICAVKICNKRKRRKQEKELNMVTARLTDRNALSQPIPLKRYLNGKSSKASRLPGLNILIAILHWIWPPGRCQNCDSIYSNKFTGDKSAINVGQIHRSADGRFVLSQDLVDGIVSLRNSIVSQYSSSDDGGFLPKRLPAAFSKAVGPAWVRPSLVAGVYAEGGDEQHHFAIPQQAQPQHHHHHHHHQQQSLYTNTMPGAAAAAAVNLGEPTSLPATLLAQTIYTTPSRVSKVVASSPATSSPQVVNSPWSPLYFSDLSSVHHPSSAERSFPTPQSVNSVHRYYNHELPVLQGLQHLASTSGGGSHHQHHHHHHHHAHSFIPVDVPVSLPYYGQSAEAAQSAALAVHDHHQQQALYQNIPWGYYGEDPTSMATLGSNATALGGGGGGGGGGTFSYGSRPKFSFSRYYPRSVPRNLNRMLPELRSPLLNLNLNTTPLSAGGGLENSPQSYSSSSGFGSKNTSSNNTQPSHHHHQQQIATVSGTAATMGHNLLREWRYLPPYRPPPPPPSLHHAAPLSIGGGRLDNPPYSMSHWLELITRLNIASEKANINNAAADVGSVDGHYEFDPSTPTPTASTPTGLMRDDFHHLMTLPSTSSDLLWSATGLGATPGGGAGAAAAITASSVVSSLSGRKRNQSRYDNIDARVQAMKEEFYEYRKRQQLQAVAGPSLVELESVC
ncbi:protein turtle-like isoform X1 [Anopheles albimanus]|uniref:protein turtle-like isoform X1 n=1 Tax=Anopheles albimanus TaxID=7167 RepID=UPI00163E0CD8|nr:protein turtle-like isoform X1 [Anopheles albimanus]XP_035779024.1 protein turtle-like isoform X1 [Anopheles albimanus]XP_035779025.1 protein turtle-like isoform X1 [Anopheles albimanus]XP_035779026.1 protein turtle-like isoform X1 [Anopheles albimanus]XP_035779027.1 protein turtle-like isoform X1 [Anopheles albimanus]XP_035779028.1 protein turtle-like isoform X1 [Anopheles albimanus]XP_035779029.1 protein turtle-like isoform X1 [Anopheles albimanus]XP_035779030.1 protein turtle-like isof